MIYSIIQASKREMLEQSLQHGIALIRKPIDYFLFKLLNMLRYSKSYCCMLWFLFESNKPTELDIWLIRIYIGIYVEL